MMTRVRVVSKVSSDESTAPSSKQQRERNVIAFFFLESRKATVSRVIFFLKRDSQSFLARLKRGGDPLLKRATNEEHKITLTETPPVLLSVCVFLAFSTTGFAFETTAFVLPLLRERERK